MQFIKDRKLITEEYIEKLAVYIKENQETFFQKENHAKAWKDFESWPDSPVDRNHLIMPNEVFLVDRNHDGLHMYCVCTINAGGRIGIQIPVIGVHDLGFNNWKAGYFLLPEL